MRKAHALRWGRKRKKKGKEREECRYLWGQMSESLVGSCYNEQASIRGCVSVICKLSNRQQWCCSSDSPIRISSLYLGVACACGFGLETFSSISISAGISATIYICRPIQAIETIEQKHTLLLASPLAFTFTFNIIHKLPTSLRNVYF